MGDALIGVTAEPQIDVPEGMEDERAWTVAQAVATNVAEFEYLYDFGDDWRHRIVIEPAARTRIAGSSPLCLAGEGPVRQRMSAGLLVTPSFWWHWATRRTPSTRRTSIGLGACGM